MSMIASYADRHAKKPIYPNRASSNEDKQIRPNRETYINYLET